MASKRFCVVMVFCVLQFAQSVEVDKRGLEIIPFIGPVLQNTVDQVTNITNGIMSLLGAGNTQAQGLVQNYTAQAAAANAAAKGPLESLMQSALDKIGEIVGNQLQFEWNSTLCAFGQKENVESVIHRAVINTGGCIQTEIQWVLELFADITVINNHAVQISFSIPGQVYDCVVKDIWNAIGCAPQIAGATASKLLLLLSSLTSDLYKLAEGGIQLPDRLMRCGAERLLEATAEVGGIISNVGVCIKQAAQNS